MVSLCWCDFCECYEYEFDGVIMFWSCLLVNVFVCYEFNGFFLELVMSFVTQRRHAGRYGFHLDSNSYPSRVIARGSLKSLSAPTSNKSRASSWLPLAHACHKGDLPYKFCWSWLRILQQESYTVQDFNAIGPGCTTSSSKKSTPKCKNSDYPMNQIGSLLAPAAIKRRFFFHMPTLAGHPQWLAMITHLHWKTQRLWDKWATETRPLWHSIILVG